MKKSSSSQKIAFFEGKRIRRYWDGKQKRWYFSVVDIVDVLTNSVNPRDYWFKMKIRIRNEDGIELSTICRQFKLESRDGKKRITDCGDIESILRIIQSIPSSKAEPFKLWLARVGYERIEEIKNPELAMERMRLIYEKKGYSKEWIDKRARGIAVRRDLTEEWNGRGVKGKLGYAILANEIMQSAFEMKVADYKKFKALKRENLRDHMNDLELILTMLGEATTTKFTLDRDSQGFPKLKNDAKDGGSVAGRTRKDIERISGGKVTSRENYLSEPQNKKLLRNKE
jgi:DNA-damage-inducible protein D